MDEAAEGTEGLLAGDLLLDDRRDQPLKHQPGSRHAPSAEPSRGLGHDGMARHKSRGVVLLAEHGRHRPENPVRTRAPRCGLQAGSGDAGQAQRRGALRSPDAAPDGAIGTKSKSRVAPTPAQPTDDREQIERPPRYPVSDLSVGHQNSLG